MTGTLLFVFFILLVCGAQVLMISAASSRVDLWAFKEHLSILEKKWRPFSQGPFLAKGGSWVVYRVVVADREGLRRSAFVAVGGEFLGLASRAITIKWDDER